MINHFEGNHHIVVDAAAEKGPVNRLILGNSFQAHAQKEDHGWMDWGGGVWNPNLNQPIPEVIDLSRRIGVSALRFPGGEGSNSYDWKLAYKKDRTEFLFGIDEFLRVTKELNAIAIITLNYFTNTEHDAADLVEYLNSPADGSNPNGGIDWAQIRADKGHIEPYGVIYFELGNEVFNGNYNSAIREPLDPAQYANDYLIYQTALQAVDPTIKLGLVLDNQNNNRIIFNIIGNRLDFMIVHTYPNPEVSNEILEEMNIERAFLSSYVRPIVLEEYFIREVYRLLRETTGLTNTPLAITEFNAGLLNNTPAPYRHALGSALLNADLIRIFMKPEHHILIANHNYLANDYWGMISSHDNYMTHDYQAPILYTKRPSYFAFKLYHENFGDTLVQADVTESSAYQLHETAFTPLHNIAEFFVHENGYTYPEIQNPIVPYITVNASKSNDGNNLYLMIVNRSPQENLSTTIDISNFPSIQSAHAWILNEHNGNDISFEAINEVNPYQVRLKHIEIPVTGNTISYNIERHSVTSIILSKNNLDHLWTDNNLDETYRLAAEDGRIYTYHPDGSLTIEHPAGAFWAVQIFKTPNGNMIWGRDRDGVEYTPNGDGTYHGIAPDGQHRQYDQDFKLTGILDTNGTLFIINADGTLTGTANDGSTSHYTADWKIISIMDPLGNTTYYATDGSIIRKVESTGTEYIWQTDGRIIGTTAQGVVTVYNADWSVYSITDADGTPILTTAADGTICDHSPDKSKTCRATNGNITQYNTNAEITSITQADGTPIMIKDSSGRIIHFDENGTITQSIDSEGNIYDFSNEKIIATKTDGTIIQYDTTWHILSQTLPDGTYILFDDTARIREWTDPSGTRHVANADGTFSVYRTDGIVILYTASWEVISITPP
jgi:alpha-L-arabinofuranosidase